jgi:hypothetical protein
MSKLLFCVEVVAFGLCLTLPAVQAADAAVAEEFTKIKGQHVDFAKSLSAAREGKASALPSVASIEAFIARFVELAEKHPKDDASIEGLLWLTARFGNMKSMDRVYDTLRRQSPTAGEYAARARNYYDDAAGMLKFAKQHPQSIAAAWSLAWIVTKSPNRPEALEATELLLKDHVNSPAVERAIPNLVHSRAANAEPLLLAVVKQNPSREIRGHATFALARIYQERLPWAAYLQKPGTPNSAAEHFLGKELAAQLQRDGPQKVQAEAEKHLTLAANEFADVDYLGKPLGEQAEAVRAAKLNKKQ